MPWRQIRPPRLLASTAPRLHGSPPPRPRTSTSQRSAGRRPSPLLSPSDPSAGRMRTQQHGQWAEIRPVPPGVVSAPSGSRSARSNPPVSSTPHQRPATPQTLGLGGRSGTQKGCPVPQSHDSREQRGFWWFRGGCKWVSGVVKWGPVGQNGTSGQCLVTSVDMSFRSTRRGE